MMRPARSTEIRLRSMDRLRSSGPCGWNGCEGRGLESRYAWRTPRGAGQARGGSREIEAYRLAAFDAERTGEDYSCRKRERHCMGNVYGWSGRNIERWLETAAVRGKTHPRDAIALYHGLLPVAAAVRATPGMTRRLKSCRPLACCGRGWMSMRNSPVNWRGFGRHIGQSATSSSCSPSCPGIALRPFRPIAQQRAHRRHRAGAGDTEKCTLLSCAVLTFTQN